MSTTQDDAHQRSAESESYLGKLYSRSEAQLRVNAIGPTTNDDRKTDYKDLEQQLGGVGQSAFSLLLRLVNETYLSLPISECRKSLPSILSDGDLSQSNSIIDNQDGEQQEQVVYDACFVDWAQAKLVKNSTAALSSADKIRNKENGFLLANLLNTQDQTNSSAHQVDNILSTIKHLNGHQQASNKSYLDHPLAGFEFVKLTYLSISTILSICGLLINLFIILIIIFNKKQKRGSSLIRSNNTNKNNLLLFQLTFTGLLLTAYVLIDNMNIQSTTYTMLPLQVSKSTHSYHEHGNGINHIPFGLKASLCSSFVVQLPPPLSTFLPLTPFESEKILCNMPNDKFANDYQIRPKEDNDLIDHFDQSPSSSISVQSNFHEYQERDIALILMFETRTSLNQNDSGNLKSWLLNHNHPNQSKFINLSDSLKSISIASSDCRFMRRRDKVVNIDHRKVRSHSVPKVNRESTQVDSDQFYLNQYSYNFGIFMLSAVPLLVNVIASIHIWTIAALAYDRYCAIAHPLQYLRSMHNSRTRTFLLVAWTTSLLLNLFIPISFNQINSSNLEQIQQSTHRVEHNPVPSQFYTWSVDNDGVNVSHETLNLFENDIDRLKDNHHHLSRKQKSKRCEFLTKAAGDETLGIDSDLSASFFLYRLEKFRSIFTTSSYGSDGAIIDSEKIKLGQDFIGKLAMLLVETSSKSTLSNSSYSNTSQVVPSELINEKFYIVLLLIFSFFNCVIIILIPLVIIAICNICIYRIVKVHERRLSISSGPSAPIESRNFNRQNCHSENLDDNRSEAGSITSLLISKLFKVGFMKASSRQDLSPTSDQGANQNCVPKHGRPSCQCEKYVSNDKLDTANGRVGNVNPNIVNRSKRLIVRQDSYQILTKLTGGESSSLDKLTTEDAQSKRVRHISNKQVSSSCNSILFNNSNPKKCQVKRKISDHAISSTPRRNSTASQFDDRLNQNQKDIECDACSYTESPFALNLDHVKYDSGGFINQLKLAGLSFAGVAIQEPLYGIHHRPLNKSSSCSLGSLYNSQHYNQGGPNACNSPMSRCSVESSSTVTSPKKSFISLNNSLKTQDNKCSTRLLDNESDNYHFGSNGHSNNYNLHQSHNRLPFTIGTKSAPFNVIIWLILAMLLFTLPHFLLVTVNHIMNLNPTNNLDLYMASVKQLDSAIYERQLLALINLISTAKPNSDGQTESTNKQTQFSSTNYSKKTDQSSFIQMTSIWLACLFRILFLTMVPLNGWLYGIRSRSIRAKIRMILKHYISRRQASIEITHRQKSTSLMRPSDSSFTNLATLYYNNPSTNSSGQLCASCNHHHNHHLISDVKERALRRSSSLSKHERACFRLSAQPSAINSNAKPANEATIDKSLQVSTRELAPLLQRNNSSKLQNNNSNSIRFLIGDYSTDRESDNSSSLPSASPNLQYLSQTTSQNSSLNGSSRSLVSTSINSQSAATSQTNSNYRQQALDILNRNYLKQTNVNMNQSTDSSKNLSNFISKKGSFHEHLPIITKTTDGLDGQIIDSSFDCLHSVSISIDEQPPGKIVCNNFKATRNYSCPTDLEQSYTALSAQRRNSTTDLMKSGFCAKIDPSNDGLKHPMRRSLSEIKFSVTPTELKHHLSDCDHTSTGLTKRLEEKTVPTDHDPHDHSSTINMEMRSQMRTDRLPHGWWKHLKQNLTKLLINVSANILSASFIENGNPRRHKLSVATKSTNLSCKKSTDSDCGQDQCRISLLRRSSAESPTKGRSEKSLASSIRIENDMFVKIITKRKKMQNSFTLNNIDDLTLRGDTIDTKCRCSIHQTNEHSDNGHREKSNHLNQESPEQSPCYLKPPSFLKLVFEPNNHASQYAGLSALSPIKECSANHSYASSRTSLNTAVGGQVNSEPTMRNLTIVEMNQVKAGENLYDCYVNGTNETKNETNLVKGISTYEGV